MKNNRFKILSILTGILILSGLAIAQEGNVDSFEDGDATSNPEWKALNDAVEFNVFEAGNAPDGEFVVNVGNNGSALDKFEPKIETDTKLDSFNTGESYIAYTHLNIENAASWVRYHDGNSFDGIRIDGFNDEIELRGSCRATSVEPFSDVPDENLRINISLRSDGNLEFTVRRKNRTGNIVGRFTASPCVSGTNYTSVQIESSSGQADHDFIGLASVDKESDYTGFTSDNNGDTDTTQGIVSRSVKVIVDFFQSIASELDSQLNEGEKVFTALFLIAIFSLFVDLLGSDPLAIGTFASGLIAFTASGWLPPWVGFTLAVIAIGITIYYVRQTVTGGG